MSGLAESADIMFWQEGYRPDAYDHPLPQFDLGLTPMNDFGLRVASFTHIPSSSANRE